MTHTQTVMLRLLTMCIPFRNLRKKWRTFLRDFLSDYDRDARRSMRAWRRHPVAGRTILILEPNYCHGEVIPGFCRHLLDMGYRVDVLMHHSLARQSPLCCFKEGDIHIFTAMCTSWKRLAKARVLTRYEAILISTSAFYDIPGWASFLHMTGLDKFANLLAVEHELKDIPRFGEEELDRQGRLLTLGSFPRGMMVNPHFFGEIPPAPRNREPVFITVGSLSAQRKNHELLVEALETVCNEGYRNFSVIIVGEGELGKIPGHLRPFLHVAGKLDFPAMYEAMRRADYFLPLLDPGNPAHNRYITTGVTGSAQLVYGFAKIPVIHEKFASFYGFNDRNALLYREETLGGAMLRAIRQTEEEYAEMQQALLQLGRDIDRESRSNLERALAACSPPNLNRPAHDPTRPPQPQVSVIVPVYNQEQYLEECITAIRRQTLAEWECIIVNDGSSDSSGEIARRFSEEDSRIRCFEQENRGVSSARNLGMRHASGRYLCFVDGDDFIDAAFLKHLLDASDRGASDLTVAGKLFCDRFPPDKIPALPTCGIFLRREFPLKNNLEFPEGIHPCEDGLFSHFVLALTEKISFCPEAVYHYRQHEQGNHQIRKRTADILPMIPRWLSLIEEFYEQRHLWKRKAGHLVRFIEHEPFELRLLGMPFSPPEQEILYSIIRDFLNAHCTAAECRRASLHLPFRLLLKSSGFSDFGRRLRRAGKNTGIRRKLLHFCPVPSWRRNGRAQLRQVREQLEEIRRNITF